MPAASPKSVPVRDVVKHPNHPYTEGLMGSIPVIGHRLERLTQIDGAMPRLTQIPKGCAFNPRCPKVYRPLLQRTPRTHTRQVPLSSRLLGAGSACRLDLDLDISRGAR